MSTESSTNTHTRALYNALRAQHRHTRSFGYASPPLDALSQGVEPVHGSETEENISNRSADGDDNASLTTNITVPSPNDDGPTPTHSLTNNPAIATRPSPPTSLPARSAFTLGKARSKPIPAARAPVPLAHLPDDWDAAFMTGVHCDSQSSRYGQLPKLCQRVVFSPGFNIDRDLPALAQKFIVQGSVYNAYCKGESLAPFTVEMYSFIAAMFGWLPAEKFRCYLDERCVAHFLESWSNVPAIVEYHRSDKHFVNTIITSLISLGGYIGELYVHKLISRSSLKTCLHYVLFEMTTIEHIQAIHHIIMRSRGGYWYNGTANDPLEHRNDGFITSFTRFAEQIPYQASLTGMIYPPSVKRTWVEEVLNLMTELSSSTS